MSFPPPQLETSWQEALKEEWSQPYLLNLASFLASERRSHNPIYPPASQVFAAFEKIPIDKVKVVIMGQDPYHGEGQAHGLSFSVQKGVSPPPSLKNIFKELQDDLHIPIPSHGCLNSWAEQGVLLLNAVLTVRANEPRSHHNKGWEMFTDRIIAYLADLPDPPIFVLWGNDAKKKCGIILERFQKKHFILEAKHPSPYSAHFGFFGCRHFSKINEQLKKQGKTAINWAIT
jgi:uracil-DNA glycosylase